MEKLFSISIIDFSLIILESWDTGYFNEMRRQLNFGFPRVFFFRTKAGVNIMRPEKDQRSFEKYILREIKSDPKYLSIRLKKIFRYLDELNKSKKKKLKKASSKDLWNCAQKTFKIIYKILPMYVVVYWLLSRSYLREYVDYKEMEKARVRSEGYYDIGDKIFKKIFKSAIAGRKQLLNYFKVIKFEELKKLLLKKQFPKLSELRKRKINYFLFKNNFLSGKLELDRTLKRYGFKYQSPKPTLEDSVIYGQTATRGKAKGHVKVILGKDELKKIRKGDVLVTATTSPDFIPAMKISAAIVTDYGGIVCHAAIVSRELRVPCIIGTKIATKVLKDGDRVEVDATKGIVKKIK